MRYYDDKSRVKKTHIVPIDKVKDFVVVDNYDDYPLFVWRENVEGDETLIPAQIIDVAGMCEKLMIKI